MALAVRADFGEAIFELGEVAHFALPDGEDGPAEAGEFGLFVVVASDVAVDFGGPEVAVGGRQGGAGAAFVAVPEAAVDEDDGAVFGQDDVRVAGQVASMESEAVAEAVEDRPDADLGGGVFALDGGHDAAALFGGELIGHDAVPSRLFYSMGRRKVVHLRKCNTASSRSSRRRWSVEAVGEAGAFAYGSHKSRRLFGV